MSGLARGLIVAALCFCGCISTPRPTQKVLIKEPIAVWPESVAEACPERKVSVECFRAEGYPWTAIHEGMANIYERLKSCLQPESEPVRIKLRIETQGGSPTCVEASVWDEDIQAYQSIPWLHDGLFSSAEIARCAATVVARNLVLPDSSPDEHCGWNSPIIFSWESPPEEHCPWPEHQRLYGLRSPR